MNYSARRIKHALVALYQISYCDGVYTDQKITRYLNAAISDLLDVYTNETGEDYDDDAE